jgi:hypothetical protein
MKKKLDLDILQKIISEEFGGDNLDALLWAARDENAGLCLARRSRHETLLGESNGV